MKYTDDSSNCAEIDFWDKKIMFVYYISLQLYYSLIIYRKGRKDSPWICSTLSTETKLKKNLNCLRL